MMSAAIPTSVLDGRYELYERLGRGGMAEVIRGWDRRLRRDVAIKFLAPRYSQDNGVVDRFRQEIAALAQLGHPHVVTVFDTGETDDGRLYLVMERLQGETLDRTLRGLRDRGEPMNWVRLAAIGRQLCGALEAAHARQIVHRDIKPSNIFRVSVDGKLDFVKLLDFGIAKVVAGSMEAGAEEGRAPVTEMGAFVGTPHYAAPELIAPERHGSPDLRADVFSLGVVLYECAAGALPFEGIPKVAVLSRTALEPLPPPRDRAPERGIPEALEAIIVRATALSPAGRYPSARALGDALAAFESSASKGSRATRLGPSFLSDAVRTGWVTERAVKAGDGAQSDAPMRIDLSAAKDRSWSLPTGFASRQPPLPPLAMQSAASSSAVDLDADDLEEVASAELADIEERTTHQRVDGRLHDEGEVPSAEVPAVIEVVEAAFSAPENPSTDVPVAAVVEVVEATAPSSPVDAPAEGVSGAGLWGTAIAAVLAVIVVVMWALMPPAAEKERGPIEIVPAPAGPGGSVAAAEREPPAETRSLVDEDVSTTGASAAPANDEMRPVDLGGEDGPIYVDDDEPEKADVDARQRACRVALKRALEAKTREVDTCLWTNGVLRGFRELEVKVRASIADAGAIQVVVTNENIESPAARSCILRELSAMQLSCKDPGVVRTHSFIFAVCGDGTCSSTENDRSCPRDCTNPRKTRK